MIRYLITFFFSSILLSWCESQNKGSIIKYSVCKTSNVCETNLKWNLITKLSLFFLFFVFRECLCIIMKIYFHLITNRLLLLNFCIQRRLCKTLQIFSTNITIFQEKMQQYMILHVSWHFLISRNFTYTRNYKICQSLKWKIWAYLEEHEIFPHFNYMNRNCYDSNIFYI